MAMIAVSVRCAFLIVGLRKRGTPLLTASTPVIAVHPLAKARTRSTTPTRLGRGRQAPAARRPAAGCPPASDRLDDAEDA